MAQYTFTLNNGIKMPGLGFGTFASEGAKGESYAAVKKALEVGYRNLDCAAFYENEEEVGDAIRDFINENPGAPRFRPSFLNVRSSPCCEILELTTIAPRPEFFLQLQLFAAVRISPSTSYTPSIRPSRCLHPEQLCGRLLPDRYAPLPPRRGRHQRGPTSRKGLQ